MRAKTGKTYGPKKTITVRLTDEADHRSNDHRSDDHCSDEVSRIRLSNTFSVPGRFSHSSSWICWLAAR